MLQLSSLLKQADSNRRKLTLTVRAVCYNMYMYLCMCICIQLFIYVLLFVAILTTHFIFIGSDISTQTLVVLIYYLIQCNRDMNVYVCYYCTETGVSHSTIHCIIISHQPLC